MINSRCDIAPFLSVEKDALTYLFEIVNDAVYFGNAVRFLLTSETALELPTTVVYYTQHLSKATEPFFTNNYNLYL